MRGYIQRKASRPAFTTTGQSYLSKPRFYTDDEITFSWSIRCVEQLPALSIEVIKIARGNKDRSDLFEIPEKVEFPEIVSERGNGSVTVAVTFKISADWDNIELGRHCIYVRMSFWGNTFDISQTFLMIRRP